MVSSNLVEALREFSKSGGTLKRNCEIALRVFNGIALSAFHPSDEHGHELEGGGEVRATHGWEIGMIDSEKTISDRCSQRCVL